MKRKIYTSLDNFKLKHTNVLSYTELNDDLEDWINENSIKLLINRNKAEMLAGEELKKYVQTDSYVEEIAEEKLGLVHNGEIIFKTTK